MAGPSVATGYFNRDEVNRAVFQARLARPNGDSAGVYFRTGDLGLLRDGELYITGRMKEILIVGGRNHYLPDIEFTLRSRELFAERTLAAFIYGGDEGEELILAAEWGRHAPKENPAQEIQACVDLIARVHYLPVRDFLLLRAGSIPRTSSGKIQRGLASRYHREGRWHGAIFHSHRASREPAGTDTVGTQKE